MVKLIEYDLWLESLIPSDAFDEFQEEQEDEGEQTEIPFLFE